MFFINAILIFAALYCGVTWLWLCRHSIVHRASLTANQHIELERETFHLGLCLILSVGFLGLIWK